MLARPAGCPLHRCLLPHADGTMEKCALMTSKSLYPLTGIVTVLNTPFTADDRIDVDGLRSHVEMAIRAGIAGILVPAMASEVHKLTMAERQRMVEAVLEQANARVPVIGGAAHTDQAGRLACVQTLVKSGCDGALLQIPLHDETSFAEEVYRCAEMQPPMLMLQDWDPGGYGLPVPLICRLFDDVGSFRCLKIEVVPAGVKYSEVLRATGGKLNVSGGWAVGQMLEGLRRGVHAFMPTAMHELYVAVYRRFAAGDRDAARDLFHRILPVLSFSNQHLDISIHFFKRLLHRQGVYATSRVRPPIMPFDAVHEQLADDLIDDVLDLTRRVTGNS